VSQQHVSLLDWRHSSSLSSVPPTFLLLRLYTCLIVCRMPLIIPGIAFLVRLRSDLLALLKDQPGLPQGAALRALSQDLRWGLGGGQQQHSLGKSCPKLCY
jgi:hypothetical protein